MILPRLIPCLLLKGGGLYKTTRFSAPRYVGDPINTVRLFNDKEVDEIVIHNIDVKQSTPTLTLETLRDLTSEAFMPMCYGGAIRTLEDASRVLEIGVEKISLNTAAVEDPHLVRQAADQFGSQSVVVTIDYTRRGGRLLVCTHGGTIRTKIHPVEHAREVEQMGAGEIMLTCIDREGTGKGYDLPTLGSAVRSLEVPVIAHGGAGSLEHVRQAFNAGASAAAAGSLFVFTGKHRAVLINYPSTAERAGIMPSGD